MRITCLTSTARSRVPQCYCRIVQNIPAQFPWPTLRAPHAFSLTILYALIYSSVPNHVTTRPLLPTKQVARPSSTEYYIILELIPNRVVLLPLLLLLLLIQLASPHFFLPNQFLLLGFFSASASVLVGAEGSGDAVVLLFSTT